MVGLDSNNSLSIADVNRIWLPEQPNMDFEWQLQTNCTQTNDTGPCHGSKSDLIQSSPKVKEQIAPPGAHTFHIAQIGRNCKRINRESILGDHYLNS